MSPRDTLLLLALWAPAAAAVHTRWSASLGVGGGFDDNVRADGSGGDALLALTPALGYLAEGRHLRLQADYDAKLWGFVTRIEGSAAQQLRVETEGGVGRHGELRLAERLRYAGDPVSLARMGLLGAQQPALRHVLRGELAWRVSRRTAAVARARHELVRFFAALDPPRAHAVSPEAALRFDLARHVRFEGGSRAQIFFAGGWTVGAAAEGEWRSSRRWTLSALGGLTSIGLPPKGDLVPRVQLRARWDHRLGALLATAGRDVGVGGWRTREATMSDQVEIGLLREIGRSLVLHVDAGLYRNGAVPRFVDDVAGYIASAAVERRLGNGFSAVASAERFAMLWGASDRHDRDQLSLHLLWSTP